MFSSHDARPEILRPLPLSLRGLSCVRCDKPTASWWCDLPTEGADKTYICSICSLYTTKWGIAESSAIEETLSRIQSVRRRTFDTDSNGRLVRSKDADDVLGVMVLASRTTDVRRMVEGWKR